MDSFNYCKGNYWKMSSDEVLQCLNELFDHLSKSAKLRDDWSFKWSSNELDICLYAISEKQNHEYALGFHNGDFYLESSVIYPWLIKYMSSEFWSVLANLDLFRNFEFQESAVVPENITFDKKTGSSSLYKLVRNYILLEEHSQDSIGDIGSFAARWSVTEPSKEITSTATQVLKGVHKLNYLLYRRDYQHRAR